MRALFIVSVSLCCTSLISIKLISIKQEQHSKG